jgi:4-amino-4-deoxy-L-arabinose transferase-like glycosyltransferase
MMDQTLGACAGFAMAAVWRSLQTGSRPLLTLGVCMACFSLMAKPTGILMIFAAGAFFVGMAS